MSNYVILKGKKDRLEIYLNSEIDFITLRDSLIDKVREARNFIGDSRIAIEFTNRELTEVEENVLIDLVKMNTDLNITYVFSEVSSSISDKVRYLKSISDEGLTKFHKGSLRSGSKIEYDGNIVIMGDVNPGSLIRAKGSVIVIGFLNGTVYAGLDGDPEAFVGALSLNPIQLTIGNIKAEVMQKEILDTNRVSKKTTFNMASVKNGEVVVEEWI